MDRSRVADSRAHCLNHWAIKVPERPSRLRMAGLLLYEVLHQGSGKMLTYKIFRGIGWESLKLQMQILTILESSSKDVKLCINQLNLYQKKQ